MDLASSLSPVLWDLLQRTRLTADLALDLFDADLKPLLPASEDPRSVALRRASSIDSLEESDVSFRSSLESGREGRISVDRWEMMLLPVRDNQQLVGLLAAVIARAHDGSSAEWVVPGPAEAAARAWRDAIERDLVNTRRARAQEHLSRRSRALAMFVTDMQQCSVEADLLNAFLQAIAVWHDVEPCAYSRDLGGQFGLRGTLAGTDVSQVATALEAGAVTDAIVRRTDDSPVLTPLGWGGKGTPLLLVVSSGSLEEWLITITGSHDADLKDELQPLMHGFATAMQRVRERQARDLRSQLWEAMLRWPDTADVRGLGRELLVTVAGGIEATDGVFRVSQGIKSVTTTASTMPVTDDTAAPLRDGYFSADMLHVGFSMGVSWNASIELKRADGRAFRPEHVTLLLAVRPVLGAWLSGVSNAGEWTSSVARQVSARILRFTDSSTPGPT